MLEFEEIYRKYFKQVYYYICSFCADDSLCEEIAQDTFYQAMMHIDSFDGQKDIRAWLFTIARNKYISFLRKRNRTVSLDPELPFADEQEPNIEERITDSENAYKIHEILHRMNEPYKEVFSLRVFGELDYESIGKIFGKSSGWARVTYYRAKTKIISELEEYDE